MRGMAANPHEDICTKLKKENKREQKKRSGLPGVSKDFVP